MMKEAKIMEPEVFSDEEFSIETERELWEGYEAWLDEQADRFEYERGLEM